MERSIWKSDTFPSPPNYLKSYLLQEHNVHFSFNLFILVKLNKKDMLALTNSNNIVSVYSKKGMPSSAFFPLIILCLLSFENFSVHINMHLLCSTTISFGSLNKLGSDPSLCSEACYFI